MTKQNTLEQTRQEQAGRPVADQTLNIDLPASEKTRVTAHVAEAHPFLEVDRNEFYTRY